MATLQYKDGGEWKNVAPSQEEFDVLQQDVAVHKADYANHNHNGGSTSKISWASITGKPFSPERIAYLEVPAGQTQTISSNLGHANNYILSATQGRAGGCIWLIVTGDTPTATKIAGAGRQGTATITDVTLKYSAHAGGGETIALYLL